MSLVERTTRRTVVRPANDDSLLGTLLPGLPFAPLSEERRERVAEKIAERRTVKPGCGCGQPRPVSPMRERAVVAPVATRRLSPRAEPEEYVTRKVAGKTLVSPTRLSASPSRARAAPVVAVPQHTLMKI